MSLLVHPLPLGESQTTQPFGDAPDGYREIGGAGQVSNALCEYYDEKDEGRLLWLGGC